MTPTRIHMTGLDDVSLSPFHEWDGKDALLANAGKVLEAIIARAKKEWSRKLSKDDALEVLTKLAEGTNPYGLHATVLNDSHLLVWQFGGMWYAPQERWIVEQFYVRIGKGSSDDALVAIDALARNIAATGTIMATALAHNDEALGRLLAKSGYQPMSSQHIKLYT